MFETDWLVALVATFVSEGLLVRPDKVAVPGEEQTVSMNTQGLVHVDGDVVIEARPRC